MFEHIIQSYIDNITMHYGLTAEFIFSKGQTVERTEPRQMFFYLCHKKGIPLVSVKKFMSKFFEFDMHHATILQSVRRIKEIIEGDPDLATFIKKLEIIESISDNNIESQKSHKKNQIFFKGGEGKQINLFNTETDE